MILFFALLFFVGIFNFSFVYWKTNSRSRATLVLVFMPLFTIFYSLILHLWGINFLLVPVTFLLYVIIPLAVGAGTGYFLAQAVNKKRGGSHG